MSYLICRECNGYYELETNESPQDFENCTCGGPLRYLRSLDIFNRKSSLENRPEMDIDNTLLMYNHLKEFKNRINANKSDHFDEPEHFAQGNSEEWNSEELEYNEYIENSEEYKEFEILKQEMSHVNLNNPKNSFSTQIIALLGFGIIPLEYKYLFGDLNQFMALICFLIISSIIMYLPRSKVIEKHDDVQKISIIWTLYFLFIISILITWILIKIPFYPIIQF